MTFKLTDKQDQMLSLFKGPERNILVYGGSRSGKTFGICYAIAKRAIMAPGSRHVIFRKSGVSVKQSVGLDTFPKVMDLAFPGVPYRYHVQDAYFTIYTQGGESEVWLAGLDDQERVDKVLGKEYATTYYNEASEIPFNSYAVANTRLAQKVDTVTDKPLRLRCYVDLNPTTKNHWTYSLWIDGTHPETGKSVDRDNYTYIVANPTDNTDNLPEDYIDSLEEMSERQKRRFLYGEYTGDIEDALWQRSHIKRTWQPIEDIPLRRVVVAIDPATSVTPGSDETGIIVAAVDRDGLGYVLADDSGKYKPEDWADRALALCDQFEADAIVGEANQGGDMVESVITSRQHPNTPRIKLVKATKDKATRAEPVAALYERGKVKHHGEFGQLEDQMCGWVIGASRAKMGYSPDRVDALVWAFTELFNLMTRKRVDQKINYKPLPSIA